MTASDARLQIWLTVVLIAVVYIIRLFVRKRMSRRRDPM